MAVARLVGAIRRSGAPPAGLTGAIRRPAAPPAGLTGAIHRPARLTGRSLSSSSPKSGKSAAFHSVFFISGLVSVALGTLYLLKPDNTSSKVAVEEAKRAAEEAKRVAEKAKRVAEDAKRAVEDAKAA